MENKRFVLDANVFLEYIYSRPLQNNAKQIIKDAILGKIEIIVPSLVLDEIIEVLCDNLNDIDAIEEHLQYIEKLTKEEVLQIIVPNTAVRMKAIEMARKGNQKSGYPVLTDCLYHSLAILNDAVFVTNDKKHISKLKSFAHIQELSSYKTNS